MANRNTVFKEIVLILSANLWKSPFQIHIGSSQDLWSLVHFVSDSWGYNWNAGYMNCISELFKCQLIHGLGSPNRSNMCALPCWMLTSMTLCFGMTVIWSNFSWPFLLFYSLNHTNPSITNAGTLHPMICCSKHSVTVYSHLTEDGSTNDCKWKKRKEE